MGVFIACLIIFLWQACLFYSLSFVEVSLTSMSMYLFIMMQAYLFTGLFITSHDAMHGTVSKNRRVNNFIGALCSGLFAFLSYKKLFKNHFLHHTHPGTGSDPDFCIHSNNFFVWWFTFLKRYVTLIQIILVALAFNLLKIYYDESSIWAFYVIPVILSTFQLFYFGTYRPHRQPHTEHMLPHNSRTQKSNHIIAMASCYFFGYHSEHHSFPKTPWWQLYKLKRSDAH